MPFFDETNFVPDSSPGYLVRIIHQHCMAQLDRALADGGPNATQWMALVSLHFGLADTCAELARHLSHDKGAMTRLMDTMEARGWVARTRGDDDRRLVRLTVTAAGLEMAMRGRRKVLAHWNEWLADWSDADIVTLIAMLRRLKQSMEKAGSCDA